MHRIGGRTLVSFLFVAVLITLFCYKLFHYLLMLQASSAVTSCCILYIYTQWALQKISMTVNFGDYSAHILLIFVCVCMCVCVCVCVWSTLNSGATIFGGAKFDHNHKSICCHAKNFIDTVNMVQVVCTTIHLWRRQLILRTSFLLFPMNFKN